MWVDVTYSDIVFRGGPFAIFDHSENYDHHASKNDVNKKDVYLMKISRSTKNKFTRTINTSIKYKILTAIIMNSYPK